jgi:hypothetical protein
LYLKRSCSFFVCLDYKDLFSPLKNWILEVAFYKGQDSSDHDKIRRMDYSLTESSKQYIEFVSYCVCIFHLSF